jgi:hypothetical protein
VLQVDHSRVQLRVLDVLTLPGALALDQRYQGGDSADEAIPRVLVTERPHRRIELTRYFVPGAAVAGEHRRKRLSVCIRAARSPTRRIKVNSAGIDLVYLLVPDTQALGGARTHVVVYDVGPLDQAAQSWLQIRVLEIERHRSLAGLGGVESAHKAALLVSECGLELDNIGTEIRQKA